MLRLAFLPTAWARRLGQFLANLLLRLRRAVGPNDASSRRLMCLFLNYSPVNTVFDWSGAPDGRSLSCLVIGTLALSQSGATSLVMKRLAPASGDSSQASIVRLQASRFVRLEQLDGREFSCLFELRLAPHGRALLRGTCVRRWPDSHFILLLDASLRPLAARFHHNCVVPDFDCVDDVILMPGHVASPIAFSISRLRFGSFEDDGASEFAVSTAGVQRLSSLHVKVGSRFTLVLISAFAGDRMEHRLKVLDRRGAQELCDCDFAEAGFSFHRFAICDDAILFVTLRSELRRYELRQEPEGHRVRLVRTSRIWSMTGAKVPCLWLQRDCQAENFAVELLSTEPPENYFRQRGLLCCSLGACAAGRSLKDAQVQQLMEICVADATNNTVTAAYAKG